MSKQELQEAIIAELMDFNHHIQRDALQANVHQLAKLNNESYEQTTKRLIEIARVRLELKIAWKLLD